MSLRSWIHRAAPALLALALAGCKGLVSESTAEADTTAPAPARSMVTGTATYFQPEVGRPPKGKPVKDSAFQTTIVRLTDKDGDGYSDKGMQNEYARSDPENSDGSLLVLRGTEASWNLYSTSSHKRLRQLGALGRGGQEAEPRWDASNPKLLYHLRDMKLMSLDVNSGGERVVHDFKQEFPRGAYVSSGSEGDPSLDRRFWCLMIKDSEWNVKGYLAYDRVADRVLASEGRVPKKIDQISASMSGRHCVIGWDDGDLTILTRDFKRALRLQPKGVGHSDLAKTADRRDVLVYQNTKTDFITMADLDTGKETNLLAIPFNKNTDIGLHFSGNCARTPGWVLVSTYGAKNPPKDRAHSWMDRQLFMVELKSSPRVWRVAQTRAILSLNPDDEKHYFAEAFATINTRGTRIYWGSNWGFKDLDRVECYAALLPDRWPRLLPAR